MNILVYLGSLVDVAKRTGEGLLAAVVLLGVVAALGLSPTLETLLSLRTAGAIFFLFVLVVVLTDMIGKFIGIVSTTLPDLVPKVEQDQLALATLISSVPAGKVVGVLLGANLTRLLVFVLIFVLLGWSYSLAPLAVQEQLLGPYGTWTATEALIRESIAGSIGYFLFFLGPTTLDPLTSAVAAERVTANSVDGEVFLAGLRLYGLPFVFAVLRTLATPLIVLRARLRAGHLAEPA